MTGIDRAVRVEPALHGTVVGGHERCHTGRSCGLDYSPCCGVHGRNGLTDGLAVLDVAHDVHVGDIGGDEG